jgi:hypothetical protein
MDTVDDVASSALSIGGLLLAARPQASAKTKNNRRWQLAWLLEGMSPPAFHNSVARQTWPSTRFSHVRISLTRVDHKAKPDAPSAVCRCETGIDWALMKQQSTPAWLVVLDRRCSVSVTTILLSLPCLAHCTLLGITSRQGHLADGRSASAGTGTGA